MDVDKIREKDKNKAKNRSKDKDKKKDKDMENIGVKDNDVDIRRGQRWEPKQGHLSKSQSRRSNQWNYQLITQQINQLLIIQSMNQSINWLINQSIDKSINQGTVDAFYAEYPVEEEKTFLETFLKWIPQR